MFKWFSPYVGSFVMFGPLDFLELWFLRNEIAIGGFLEPCADQAHVQRRAL